ncbi:MAG TPA: DUF1844 domain-containing protein [Polyangiaceae bacterium LLY-WYZ-14_1]|nr:DUF1844 domain-containing protein [Polyangiaceae bacterium LLY-WYZ-14_1]
MSEPPADDPSRASPTGADGAPSDHDDQVPPIDFTTFVMSLVTTANLNLDEQERGQDALASYAMACQTLDLLRLLETKTQGNLTGEEERVLVDLIDQLDGRCRSCGPKKAAG